MKSNGNFTAFRKAVLIAAICSAIAAVAVCLFNAFGLWDKLRDVDALAAWINSKGSLSILVYAAFVLCSVLFLPVPSTVMNYLAAVLFDKAWITFLITTAATLVGSFICYFLGKIFGKRIVIWLAGKEKAEKYSRVVNENGKPLIFAMLLLPFFPDDVICLLAGASGIGFAFFAVACIIARPVMIAVVSFLGKSATEAMDSWGLPVGIAIVALIILATMLFTVFNFRRKSGKNGNKNELQRTSERTPPAASNGPMDGAEGAVDNDIDGSKKCRHSGK